MVLIWDKNKCLGSVAIRISGEKTITAGRHFQQEDSFTSIVWKINLKYLDKSQFNWYPERILPGRFDTRRLAAG
jgi:hypothetical protein